MSVSKTTKQLGNQKTQILKSLDSHFKKYYPDSKASSDNHNNNIGTNVEYKTEGFATLNLVPSETKVKEEVA